MNRHILLPAASLFALLLGGCSKSPSPAPDDPQKGAIAFACTVSPEVAVVADGTKAGATRTLPASCLPAPSPAGGAAPACGAIPPPGAESGGGTSPSAGGALGAGGERSTLGGRQ